MCQLCQKHLSFVARDLDEMISYGDEGHVFVKNKIANTIATSLFAMNANS